MLVKEHAFFDCEIEERTWQYSLLHRKK